MFIFDEVCGSKVFLKTTSHGLTTCQCAFGLFKYDLKGWVGGASWLADSGQWKKKCGVYVRKGKRHVRGRVVELCCCEVLLFVRLCWVCVSTTQYSKSELCWQRVWNAGVSTHTHTHPSSSWSWHPNWLQNNKNISPLSIMSGKQTTEITWTVCPVQLCNLLLCNPLL